MWSSSAPGWQGSRRPATSARPRARRDRARGTRPGRRADPERADRRRQGRRGRRPVGRPDPGPRVGADRASSGSRRSRPTPRARTSSSAAASSARYTGTIPRANPFGLAEVGVAMKRLDRMAARCRSTRRGRRRMRAGWDSETFATWMRRNVRTAVARDILRLAIIGVWAAEPARRLAAARPLLHPLGRRRSRSSLDTEGGAQQDRIVGGSQLISLADGRAARPTWSCSAPRCARSATATAASRSSPTASRSSAQRAIVAIPPTLAGRIDYDPPLPALPRPAHPADAQGSRGQVHGRLRARRSGAPTGSPAR